MEFEGNAIYLHRDNYEHSILKNGLWVEASEDMAKRSKEIDQ